MSKPPRYHDPEPHVRVGREPRLRPALTGVRQLLAQQWGETTLEYGCAEGMVRVVLGWRLSPAETTKAHHTARPLSSSPGSTVARALAETFRCEVTCEIEVHR